MHKSCAARLSDSFSSQLRSGIEVTLGSIEQVTGAELLDRVPDPSYLLFVRTSYNATALLQMDLALAFPFLDILLGGSGAESPEPRELTEIELGILEPLARSAARSLQENWQSLLNVSFEVDSPAHEERPERPAACRRPAPPGRFSAPLPKIRRPHAGRVSRSNCRSFAAEAGTSGESGFARTFA